MLGYKPVADLGFNQITKSLNIPHHMVVGLAPVMPNT
jgi:hypothetical protein